MSTQPFEHAKNLSRRLRRRPSEWDVGHQVAMRRATYEPRIRASITKVRNANLTYLDERALIDLATVARHTRTMNGIIVEAGSALGGSAIVLAAAKDPQTPLHLYDVFGTIPAPSEADGQAAAQRFEEILTGRSKGIGGGVYYGYRNDLVESVQTELRNAGFEPAEHSISLHPGLFQDTLDLVEPVALAHLDCDWYDSVSTCLDRIWPWLVPGGVVVIDDYFHWEGCRVAVDDFLARTSGVRAVRRSRLHLVKAGE
jgi:predicted O-methyltransferase YrrM